MSHDATTEHHSPEESVHLLRSELDACRAEIERLRPYESLVISLAKSDLTDFGHEWGIPFIRACLEPAMEDQLSLIVVAEGFDA